MAVKHDRQAFDASNLTAAAVILSDSARYGGPDSLACRWAALVTERQAPKAEQGELFIEVDNGPKN